MNRKLTTAAIAVGAAVLLLAFVSKGNEEPAPADGPYRAVIAPFIYWKGHADDLWFEEKGATDALNALSAKGYSLQNTAVFEQEGKQHILFVMKRSE